MSRNIFGHVAPNGLNFGRSIYNKNSRLARVIRYITDQNKLGISPTRRRILYDVFGKSVDKTTYSAYLPNVVSSGWASYLFNFGVKNGFLTKKRVGKTYVYELGKLAWLVSI